MTHVTHVTRVCACAHVCVCVCVKHGERKGSGKGKASSLLRHKLACLAGLQYDAAQQAMWCSVAQQHSSVALPHMWHTWSMTAGGAEVDGVYCSAIKMRTPSRSCRLS